MSYEEALEKLEAIVESLDGDDIPLETLVRQYGEGVQLLKQCQENLRNARQKIDMIAVESGESETATGSEISSPDAGANDEESDEIRLF